MFQRQKAILDRTNKVVGTLVDDFEKDPEREGRAGTVLSKMVTLNKEGGEEGKVTRKVSVFVLLLFVHLLRRCRRRRLLLIYLLQSGTSVREWRATPMGTRRPCSSPSVFPLCALL